LIPDRRTHRSPPHTSTYIYVSLSNTTPVSTQVSLQVFLAKKDAWSWEDTAKENIIALAKLENQITTTTQLVSTKDQLLETRQAEAKQLDKSILNIQRQLTRLEQARLENSKEIESINKERRGLDKAVEQAKKMLAVHRQAYEAAQEHVIAAKQEVDMKKEYYNPMKHPMIRNLITK
jgi:septal ring factor EnvC (AmiA/AmiB activator)